MNQGPQKERAVLLADRARKQVVRGAHNILKQTEKKLREELRIPTQELLCK